MLTSPVVRYRRAGCEVAGRNRTPRTPGMPASRRRDPGEESGSGRSRDAETEKFRILPAAQAPRRKDVYPPGGSCVREGERSP